MIIIIDFGSQFTQLVARRIREFGVYSEIITYKNKERLAELFSNQTNHLNKQNINNLNSECAKEANHLHVNDPIEGVIFSGGPFSVYENQAPKFDYDIESLNVPLLGICYGFQLINFMLGGTVSPAEKREYGFEQISLTKSSAIKEQNPLYSLVQNDHTEHTVWMSHGDEVKKLSAKLTADSFTRNNIISSFHHINKKIFGVQFHPEVEHTKCGKNILKYFIENICKCENKWFEKNQIESIVNSIKNKINFHFINKKETDGLHAICALSGGVDSCVAAVLASKVFGDRLHCLFIDNGLLRKNEFTQILEKFQKHLHLNVKGVDASNLFLSRLKGVVDAEEKRKIIGKTFIEIFEQESAHIPNAKFLVQGTLYPDVVESVPIYGSSSTIKTHHNVGGLPKDMKFILIEPLRELFKDEVRRIGQTLGISHEFLGRHPFPGPGLAVRILGDITKEKLNVLREADAILTEELKKHNLYDSVWQAFVVLLPIYTVGVMGDARTYENVAAIRCVSSIDGMTADWSRLPHEFLASVSSKITNEVKGINRVVYDVSSKPPATIEWE